MKRESIFLVVILGVGGFCISAHAAPLAGSGTEGDPYLIEDLADFDVFADPCNADIYWASGVHTKLMCDPNLFGRIYTTAIIAPDTSINGGFQGTAFSGVFDGDSHKICTLTIDTLGAHDDYLGLFGYIDGDAEINNLGIENACINGGADIGGLVGYNNEGTISYCYVTGSITGSCYLGGLCGLNYGTISNCHTICTVTGDCYLGGLCGDNRGTINNCYATGSITGDQLGGLCGGNRGTISNCYATGSVTGDHQIGGLSGNNSGTIINCYATGSITGSVDSHYLGGLCGYNSNGTISNSYSIGSLTVGDNSDDFGGLCGFNKEGTINNCYFYLFGGIDNHLGNPLDDMQMIDAASFSGFDFTGDPNDGTDDYWDITSGFCPKLSWQTDNGPLFPDYMPVTTLSGSGYSYDPFQINSLADFNEFITNSSLNYGFYILTTDIDPNAYGQTFDSALVNRLFGGHFNGSNHVIRNITIDTAGASTDYMGLFSQLQGYVSNLGIENITITGGTGSFCLGGLCGKNMGTISNCYVTGSVTGRNCLGGLCGLNEGTISRCHAAGSVTGDYDFGGLCGWNEDYGIISNCYATGLVSSPYSPHYLGGLCGWNDGTISNCYATGPVTGGNYSESLGGLSGRNRRGTISNCYATGSITGGDSSSCLGGLCGFNEYGRINNCNSTGSVTGGTDSESLGGLCGVNHSGTISNCYSIGSVTGGDWLGGLVGANRGPCTASFWDIEIGGPDNGVGISKTTLEMQDPDTFLEAGWDFVGETVNGPNDIWTIWEGAYYPRLAWENPLSGDFALDNLWMYQNLPGQTNSNLIADVLITDDPLSNGSYSYEWEIVLPDDVTIAPTITASGGFSDPCCTFAAPSCNEPNGLSDSGQTFTVRVTITGADYDNTGIAEAQFGIALLGDANNDGVVNVADRSIINAFWRLGAAGPYTFTDCDINCDEAVNVADRSIANAVWRGVLGQNRVSSPCPLR